MEILNEALVTEERLRDVGDGRRVENWASEIVFVTTLQSLAITNAVPIIKSTMVNLAAIPDNPLISDFLANKNCVETYSKLLSE